METKIIEFDWINIFVKIALSLIIVISVEVALLLRNQGHINLAQNKRVDQQHWRSVLYLQVEIILQAWRAELKGLLFCNWVPYFTSCTVAVLTVQTRL